MSTFYIFTTLRSRCWPT